VSLSEGVDTREAGTGKMVLALFGQFAEMEHDRISERVSDFRTHLANKGQWSSGRTPFGYRFDKTTKQLEIYETEADAVRFAFGEYTKPESIGIVKLAEILNSAQYPPPRAFRDNQKSDFWTQTTVRHILTHPAYKGGPNERWKFSTPAIINPDVWLLAQKRLETNRHFRDSNGKSLYQGLFRCGLCDHVLRIGYNHSTEKVWECPGRLKRLHTDGSARCTLPRFKTDKLEGIVVEKVTDLFSDPEMLKNYISDTLHDLEHENKELKRRIKPTQSNIDKLTEALKRADVRYELGRLSHDEYKDRVSDLRSSLHDLEQKLDETDPMLLRKISNNEQLIDYWNKFAENHEKLMDSLLGQGEIIDIEGENGETETVNIDALANKAFAVEFGDFGKFPIIVDPRIIDEPDLVATEQLRKLNWICYVYPDKVELQGTVKPEQINIASACMSVHSRQSR
jgi:site-specific DNA recombinase